MISQFPRATHVNQTNSRVIYAWENPGVPVDQVVNDVLRAFHHPALRDESIQIQRDMFATVRTWVQETRIPIDQLLSSESVKSGKNQILPATENKSHAGGGHNHGTFGAFQDAVAGLGHGKVKGSLWSQIQTRDLSAMGGGDGSVQEGYMSNSPAPRPISSSGFGYQGGGGAAAPQQPPPGAVYGQAASYYSGAASPQPPVPEPGYGGGGYGYGGPQPPPPGPYGGPWGGQGPPPPGPPPPGYGGGPMYGQRPPPPFPPYGGPPPPQPGWNPNPGGYPGGNHRW
jgi:hypothetical protein